MTVTTCARCNCVRDPFLLGALPCEQCGASPEQVADAELPADDSWSGTDWREVYDEREPQEGAAA